MRIIRGAVAYLVNMGWGFGGCICAVLLYGCVDGTIVRLVGKARHLAPGQTKQKMSLAGGQQDGLYYLTALNLRRELLAHADVLFDAQTPVRIEVLATEGSLDNYQRLLRKEVDAAIIQDDFLAKMNGGGENPPVQRVQSADGEGLAFYREDLMLVCLDADLAAMTAPKEWKAALRSYKFKIPPKRMGAHKTTKALLAELQTLGADDEYANIPTALSELIGHQIDGFFTVSGVGDVRIESAQADVENPEMHIVTFPAFATSAGLCVRTEDRGALKKACEKLADSPVWKAHFQRLDHAYSELPVTGDRKGSLGGK